MCLNDNLLLYGFLLMGIYLRFVVFRSCLLSIEQRVICVHCCLSQRVSVNMKTLDYNANVDEELQTVLLNIISLIIISCLM